MGRDPGIRDPGIENPNRKVRLVDLFKTMELLNNRYAFYMLGRGSPDSTPIGYRILHCNQ